MQQWQLIAEILGNLGQFAFGLIAVVLSVLAIITKHSDVFKSELARKQFSELGEIRQTLGKIFYDVGYVAAFKGMVEVSGGGLEQFRKECPAEWEQYQRYKENSLSTFYKFATPGYYLFPKWVDAERVKELYRAMQEFAPFTISAAGRKDMDAILKYQNEIVKFMAYLDENLRKRS